MKEQLQQISGLFSLLAKAFAVLADQIVDVEQPVVPVDAVPVATLPELADEIPVTGPDGGPPNEKSLVEVLTRRINNSQTRRELDEAADEVRACRFRNHISQESRDTLAGLWQTQAQKLAGKSTTPVAAKG